MNIVFVDRDGAKSIWELMGHIAVECLRQGGRATFVMWDDGGQAYSQGVPDGVDVISIRVPPKRWFWDLLIQHLVFARAFRQLLSGLKPDIVHTNFAVPSIIARWLAAQEKVPLIISTQHEICGSMRAHYRWGLRLTERYCAAVVYVSHTVARSFGRTAVAAEDLSRIGQTTAHVVIPNGVDIAGIRAAVAGAGDRVPGRIVCSGRMVPEKGQMLLINALPEAIRRHPHICLRLIGSGPMQEALHRRVDELELTDHVVFMGWCPHDAVLREMAEAELVVVPSDGTQEGYGLVVAEALVCRTPLLVSDIPVFREVLEGTGEQVNFFVSGDGNALAKALTEYPFAKLGERPTATDLPVKELKRLSSDAMADSYMRLYRMLT